MENPNVDQEKAQPCNHFGAVCRRTKWLHPHLPSQRHVHLIGSHEGDPVTPLDPWSYLPKFQAQTLSVLGHTSWRGITTMINIRTGAAIILSAMTISFAGSTPAALAHADTGAVSTANQQAVLVTSHSFTATEQAFITDVESMVWYPSSAVGNTELETDMVKLGWTVVHAVNSGVSPSAAAAVIYRSFSKVGMSRDDAVGLVQFAEVDLTGSSSVDPGSVV
jgi:hypothetical protein